MAYYSSNYFEVYPVYHQNPYDASYEVVPSPPWTPCPNDNNDYNLLDYPATSYYYGAYDSAASRSIVSYSASTFSEPKYIEYEPHFTISYSVAEFNLPEFEEYDPTPYAGGFDLAEAYGKSLPPSEQTCYPRSSADSTAPSSNGFSYGSIPSPYGKEQAVELAAKPRDETKPTTANEDQRQILGGNEPAIGKPLESDKGEESKESCGTNFVENGPYGDQDHGYEYERTLSQTPPGYGLEAMDICEGIFGYWPCLYRNGGRLGDYQQDANAERYSNQWKETADYLFGSSYPYSERRDAAGSYESVIYGYHSHYQQQSVLYRQAQYGEDSWNGEFNIL